MRNYKRLSLVWVLIALGFMVGCSKSTSVSEVVTKLFSSSEMTALSIAFVTDDGVRTYHYGEFVDGSLPSDDTIFDIGSITKTHVGLILAQAVSDELIVLDTPVSQYLAEIPKDALSFQGTEITVRHLATHTSGLPTDLACTDATFTPDEKLMCFTAHDDADLLRVLNDYELGEKPGTTYRYSNSGIRILGRILEDLYETPMEKLLQNIVFKSTGQTKTYPHLTANQRLLWRRGTHENGLSVPDASGYFNAAGGLKSTTQDMGRYISFYINKDNKLAQKALTLLAGDQRGLGRAYIWNTFRLDAEGQYYHGGGTFGTSAWISLYPEERLGIFLVTPYASATTQEQLNMVSNEIMAIYRRQKNGGPDAIFGGP